MASELWNRTPTLALDPPRFLGREILRSHVYKNKSDAFSVISFTHLIFWCISLVCWQLNCAVVKSSVDDDDKDNNNDMCYVSRPNSLTFIIVFFLKLHEDMLLLTSLFYWWGRALITHLMNGLGRIRMLIPPLILLSLHQRHKSRNGRIMITIVIMPADIYRGLTTCHTKCFTCVLSSNLYNTPVIVICFKEHTNIKMLENFLKVMWLASSRAGIWIYVFFFFFGVG